MQRGEMQSADLDYDLRMSQAYSSANANAFAVNVLGSIQNPLNPVSDDDVNAEL